MSERYYPWHTWFAWRPVHTPDYGWVWLRRIARRRVRYTFPLGIPNAPDAQYEWEYRALNTEGEPIT